LAEEKVARSSVNSQRPTITIPLSPPVMIAAKPASSPAPW